MKKFYFTFGQDHVTKGGQKMRNYWVTVEAVDYYTARELFCDEFAEPEMGDPARWSFQYSEGDENWKPGYFPGGQYRLIKQAQS